MINQQIRSSKTGIKAPTTVRHNQSEHGDHVDSSGHEYIDDAKAASTIAGRSLKQNQQSN